MAITAMISYLLNVWKSFDPDPHLVESYFAQSQRWLYSRSEQMGQSTS